jgi:hypothetical protein
MRVMDGEIKFREPFVSPRVAAYVAALLGYAAASAGAGALFWQRSVLVVSAVLVIKMLVWPGRLRVVLDRHAIRTRDSAGERSAALGDLVDVEWEDTASLALRDRSGELFVISRGHLDHRQWRRLRDLIEERSPLTLPADANPFVRAATRELIGQPGAALGRK